jgi:hypothetical protein
MTKQKLQCPFCPKISTRGTGLASHIRGAHPAQYADWSKSRKGAVKGALKTGAVKPTALPVAGGLDDIISRLEQQRDAVDSALAALREVLGPVLGSSMETPAPRAVKTRAVKTKAKRKGGMTPEGRARLIAALKQRWAAKKAAASAPAPAKKRGRPRANA